MERIDRIRAIQGILGVTQDGDWGPETQAALDDLLQPVLTCTHVMASSFADPADIAAFRRCKAEGKSDLECFKVGDNGIGCWGDDVTTDEPACALPPEDMITRWGGVDAAKHREVMVEANGMTVCCILKDRMPHRAQITNGAGIDLSPAACAALGLTPPVMVRATWWWKEG